MTGAIDNKLKSEVLNKSSDIKGDRNPGKMKEDFMKMMIASMQNTNPFSEKQGDVGKDMVQTLATIEQTEAMFETKEAFKELIAQQKETQFSKALGFQGKSVKYDVSTQEFSGQNAIEYSYQIKYQDSQIPKGGVVVTNLSIKDKNGIEVFKDKGKTTRGAHKYIWDGRDSSGKIMDEGEYTMSVNSYFQYQQDGVSHKKPIEAGCFFEGAVESLEREGEDVYAIINGEKVDIFKITQVDFSESLKPKKPQLDEFAGYIGKTAKVKNDQAIVDNKGNIKFEFDASYPRPGNAALKLYDEDNNIIGIAISNTVSEGRNNNIFTAIKAYSFRDAEQYIENPTETSLSLLENGKYRAELFIQDTSSEHPLEYLRQDNSKSISITGLDFEDGEFILSGSERYALDSIQSLGKPDESRSMLDSAANFLNKTVKVRRSTFEFDGRDAKISLKIPQEEKGRIYNQATLIIFDDDGKKIAEIKKPRKDLIVTDKEFVLKIEDHPRYEISTLQSKFASLSLEDRKKIICDDYGFTEGSFSAEMSVKDVKELFDKSTAPSNFFQFIKDIAGDKYEFDYDIRLVGDAYRISPDLLPQVKVISEFSEIVENFDRLSKKEQDIIINSVVSNNSTESTFNIDSKSLEGLKLPKGVYSYRVELETESTSGGESQIEAFNNTKKYEIDEYRIINGEIYFVSTSGVRDEIFKRDEIITIVT